MKRVRHRNAGVRQRRPPRPGSTATYGVGYGKPPREHKFQPGQSGNRKGRPKGAKNTVTLVREILDRRIEITIRGIVRKVSIREAMLTRFTDSGLNGDIKAAAFLLQHYDMSGTGNEDATDSAMQDDLEIIKAFFEDPKSKGELK
jgi:Family of unknown function (DUF5681)